VRFTTNFLWMCEGYYRHADGFTPDWPGMDRFSGRIVHPQTWPDDLDLVGKNVVVIGSGATAATLVPAIAADCAHVTILQRSPTYFYSGPNSNELADVLRELEIPEEWVHEIVRRKILHDQEASDVETHFTPRYRPWRQRIAFLPGGDLFAGISSGKELVADVVVTATGFNLSILGDIEFAIDGAPLDLAATVTYRGMMCTGVPNLAWIFGYALDGPASLQRRQARVAAQSGLPEREGGSPGRRPRRRLPGLRMTTLNQGDKTWLLSSQFA
jgi:cation diffusion facilitator CzcD-associated flavoprotein CzcO